jgi:hypothetical protein
MPEPRPYMTDAAADALIASVLDRLFEVESGLPPDVSERTVAGLLGRHLEYALRESPAAGGAGASMSNTTVWGSIRSVCRSSTRCSLAWRRG